MQPNLDWYASISKQHGLSPRCPFASVYRCPRFYQSLSLLGEAGSTKIDPAEDRRLKEGWRKTDLWPVTDEQATSISGPGNEITHFSHFCPEVSFDRFGLFATDLHKYTDEIDIGNAHKVLRKEGASQDDWRWSWWHIVPLHYTECPLYSLIKLEKGRKEVTENQRIWDRITRNPVYVTIGLLGSIASIIALWFIFSPGNVIKQDFNLESSTTNKNERIDKNSKKYMGENNNPIYPKLHGDDVLIPHFLIENIKRNENNINYVFDPNKPVYSAYDFNGWLISGNSARIKLKYSIITKEGDYWRAKYMKNKRFHPVQIIDTTLDNPFFEANIAWAKIENYGSNWNNFLFVDMSERSPCLCLGEECPRNK